MDGRKGSRGIAGTFPFLSSASNVSRSGTFSSTPSGSEGANSMLNGLEGSFSTIFSTIFGAKSGTEGAKSYGNWKWLESSSSLENLIRDSYPSHVIITFILSVDRITLHSLDTRQEQTIIWKMTIEI